MTKIFQPLRPTAGFTLLETILSISIFLVIITITFSVLADAFWAKQRTEVSRLLYEETRILLERIVREVRAGTIDYEEYWNRFEKNPTQTENHYYGKNYGTYALQFFRDSNGAVPASLTAQRRQDENLGLNAGSPALRETAKNLAICAEGKIPAQPAESGFNQCELYLISTDGLTKTILKIFPKDQNASSKTEYTLKILKLKGLDNDGDLIPETWEPLPDFRGFQFQNIQPEALQLKNLQFFIAPREDPRKAFANFSDSIQVQPHVLIKITAEPSHRLTAGLRGKPPEITLQTTISARASSEIKSL